MFKNYRLFLLLLLMLCATIILSGCGKVSESDISSFIPETITTYKLNGQLYSQEIKDINIVRRQTEGKSDFIECEIRLEDENLERTVYADLYLTKYDTGGWILDNWSPYASEDYTNKTKPGSEIMDEALEDLDYELADDGTEDVSSLNDEYVIVYTIDEEHEYGILKGTVTLTSYFDGDDATNSSVATYGWGIPLYPKEDIWIEWAFEGTYSGVRNEGSDNECSFIATISSIDSDGNVSITGEYTPPAGEGPSEKFNSAKTEYGLMSKYEHSDLEIRTEDGHLEFCVSLDEFKVLDAATELYRYDVTKIS